MFVLEVARAVRLQQRDEVVVLVLVGLLASSTCQMSNPAPGSSASKPACWRFSSRKYSCPPPPSFHSRCTCRLRLHVREVRVPAWSSRSRRRPIPGGPCTRRTDAPGCRRRRSTIRRPSGTSCRCPRRCSRCRTGRGSRTAGGRARARTRRSWRPRGSSGRRRSSCRRRRTPAASDPFVRPDVVGVAGLLAARAGVHDDEGVDESVAVVVVRARSRRRVGGRRRRPGPGCSARGSPEGLPMPELPLAYHASVWGIR